MLSKPRCSLTIPNRLLTLRSWQVRLQSQPAFIHRTLFPMMKISCCVLKIPPHMQVHPLLRMARPLLRRLAFKLSRESPSHQKLQRRLHLHGRSKHLSSTSNTGRAKSPKRSACCREGLNCWQTHSLCSTRTRTCCTSPSMLVSLSGAFSSRPIEHCFNN